MSNRNPALAAALVGLLLMAPAMAPSARAQEHILSIGGDVTETLYALGLGDRIVAVDTTSQFPPEALRQKPNVGYMRALSAESVLSVGAKLIVASDKAGPADVVKALKASAAYVEILEDPEPAAIPAKIEAIGQAVGKGDDGRRLADKVRQDLAALAAERAKITRPLRALFVLNVQSGRLVVGGTETSADAMLRLCGLDNAAGSIRGYKPTSDEALLAMQPELVVVMRSVVNHETGDVAALPGLAATPAGRQRNILFVDGGEFLAMGPRVAASARALMDEAYGRPHPAAAPKGN
ncbi:MAG: ABC transporter substrate-binding protein [Hyphomicrobiaceae bacterium]|nr:ABC transporter substrate-binding protein [Hyphomicrobiaceae bacterium]